MYDKRIKIFIIVIALLLLVCSLRLTQMQLLSGSFYLGEIAKLKLQSSRSRRLNTIRGIILDRKGAVLAVDEPRFHLHIDYTLASFADERVIRSKLLRAALKNDPDNAEAEVREEIQAKLQDLEQIIEKCTYFGLEHVNIEDRIKQINDQIWNLRTYLAWKRRYPNRDFDQAVPDPNDRLLLAAAVDIAEMHRSWPLFELETEDDIFTAQLEFLDISGVGVSAKGRRSYPYGTVAAQTIGWVGPASQQDDKKLFEHDRLSSYLEDEVCGREGGVEYVCETVLRGRRGEELYDIDRKLVNRTETRFGKDVSLTLDIDLQQQIEKYLADSDLNLNSRAPTAAVVIDVATGHILALVSMPVFDLNRARYDYAALADDPNEPLRNRAIYKQYPPGSAVKPIILIAGLESGKITADEIIPCPAQKAPRDWPSCWMWVRWRSGHDIKGVNNARNALMWSCNIYFSRLADRIEPLLLQHWLFNFGYGHKVPLAPPAAQGNRHNRDLRQEPGQISTAAPKTIVSSFEQLPPLKKSERRLFGIGQANLRVTPLQVANAFAAIARGGIYRPPTLFMPDPNDSEIDSVDLNISPQTLDVIHDGMRAVVNEPGGTAYKEFAPVIGALAQQGISIHGKTGSTEKPDHAWFAGFATDSNGRSISIAVVVEGGQHGSSDAGPLAREIIQFCIEAGYIGQTQLPIE